MPALVFKKILDLSLLKCSELRLGYLDSHCNGITSREAVHIDDTN